MDGGLLPQRDELYVVSDLHIGGASGFQILKHGARLGALIRWIAAQRKGERVELVLDGDVIDSLAEDIQGYVAIDDAEPMMQRLYKDPAFQPIWDGLAHFVRQPGRSLVIVLGNHDIELALPAVQRSVRARLAGDDDAAQGRISFATIGAGHACRVGDATVFCTHGNEVDPWNVVDYDALRQLAMSQNAGAPFDRTKWEPNAGTRLVKDVMNEVKRRHPWIDLLKPEGKALVGVLLSLDPSQAGKLQRSFPIVWDRLRGELKTRGLLSADEQRVRDPKATEREAMRQLLGPSLLQAVEGGDGSADDADGLLLQAELEIEGARPSRARPADGTLGWTQMVWDRLTGVDPIEALRRALADWLEKDRTFDLTTRDLTFEGILKRVGPSVDFVVTGHTHLERAIQLEEGVERFYYNCGTWIRLLRLTRPLLEDAKAFRETYGVLAAGSMDALDRAEIPAGGGKREPFVLDRTGVVRISAQKQAVAGALCRVRDAPGGSVTLEPAEGSEFRRRSR